MEFRYFIECAPGCHQTGLRLCSSEIQFKSNRLCAPGRLRTLLRILRVLLQEFFNFIVSSSFLQIGWCKDNLSTSNARPLGL